jgi:hypothetical protein
MPVDPEDILADIILNGGRAASLGNLRNWNVPIHMRQRQREQNPTAGDASLQEVAPVFTVGWDGIGTTTYPFTPNVSLLDGSFMSVDIVTG